MRFECGDLERALANADLMPEAREHLKGCPACRREYRLWNEISTAASGLHQEWDSPALWPNIRKSLEAERKPREIWWKTWRTWAIAATLLIAIALPLLFSHHSGNPAMPNVTTADRDFLTDQALEEVERNEAAYRKSIDKLSRLAAPKLESASVPKVVNAKEKLLLLDSAISETRSNVASNRFNVSLQQTLAGLYRQKQQTLQEVLKSDAKN